MEQEKNKEEINPDKILDEMNKPMEEEETKTEEKNGNPQGFFNIPVHIEIGTYYFDMPLGLLLVGGVFLFILMVLI